MSQLQAGMDIISSITLKGDREFLQQEIDRLKEQIIRIEQHIDYLTPIIEQAEKRQKAEEERQEKESIPLEKIPF